MRTLLAACALTALATPAIAQHQHGAGDAAHADHAAHSPAQHALTMAVDNPNRAEDSARDAWRNPAETLTFFQVEPTMKVGEYAPGGGWYSRLLGNYLGEQGQLVGLYYDPTSGPFNEQSQEGIRRGAAGFPAEAAGFTGLPAERFAGMTLETIPEDQAGSFDRILVIRMMHNLMRWNIADSEIKQMRELLKSGGMLGIVQHRAPEEAAADYANGSKGYLRQADVVGFVEALGFELVGSSEVNANPADSADHPEGVWEVKPSWRTKRPELENIGESDRMTLLFRKR